MRYSWTNLLMGGDSLLSTDVRSYVDSSVVAGQSHISIDITRSDGICGGQWYT